MTKEIKYSKNWISKVSARVSVDWPQRGERVKSVIYVSGAPNPEDIYPDVWTPERITQLDDERRVAGSKIWKQYNKAEVELAVRAIRESIPEIEDQLAASGESVELSEYKIVFDRKAGCSCGCSPGYRFKTAKYRNISLHEYKRVEIWVDLETASQEQDKILRNAEGDVRRARYEIENNQKQIDEVKTKLALYTEKESALTETLQKAEQKLTRLTD